jgi:hypothetical protein
LSATRCPELHHIDVTNDHFLIERLARPAINQPDLGMLGQLRVLEITADFLFFDAVEHRRGEFQAEELRSPAEVRFQDLSHVHT